MSGKFDAAIAVAAFLKARACMAPPTAESTDAKAKRKRAVREAISVVPVVPQDIDGRHHADCFARLLACMSLRRLS
jgi:hypothetical protein